MAKTETNVSNLKINRGTYAKIQENIDNISENELIILTDKNVPIPQSTDEGKVIKVNASGNYELGTAGGSTPDSDVTVEIENDYTSTAYASRTNYATAISLQEWIANCEAGNVYTNAGIIAKVNNLISGKAFRLILIGTNHEVLAYDDTTQAKTTWQFLDMPEHNVRLGLPINVLDMGGTDSRAQLNAFLDGTNASQISVFSTNMDGLISAQGLLQVNETIFDELPDTLKRHIKVVRRYYYRKRNYMTIEASGGTITNSGQMCQLAQGIFHLAGTDLGTQGQSGEGSGSKYNYFAANANYVRYYNGTATSYWNASFTTYSAANWCAIRSDGTAAIYDTYDYRAVAPAFCI